MCIELVTTLRVSIVAYEQTNKAGDMCFKFHFTIIVS